MIVTIDEILKRWGVRNQFDEWRVLSYEASWQTFRRCFQPHWRHVICGQGNFPLPFGFLKIVKFARNLVMTLFKVCFDVVSRRLEKKALKINNSNRWPRSNLHLRSQFDYWSLFTVTERGPLQNFDDSLIGGYRETWKCGVYKRGWKGASWNSLHLSNTIIMVYTIFSTSFCGCLS